jgi:glycosyltransferase involved in cell wall biosynthesis
LPCRDAEPYLREAIASLEAQTFRDFEVIAVDDGSQDGTPRALREWAKQNNAVRIIHTPRQGLVTALETARLAASSDILARMDSDDRAHPQRFQRQLQLLDEYPDLAACGTGVRYFPQEAVREGARRYETWINTLQSHAAIANDVFVECPIPHPTLMVRRSALEDVGGYRDPGWPEDYDLVLRLWAAGHQLAKTPEILLDWRENPGRLSRNDTRYSEDSFRRCKVHWLRQTLLKDRTTVVIWGAGPVGKRFALELAAEQVKTIAFVDVDPRKIGQTIHGAPVIAPDQMREFPDTFAIAAVGSDDARAEIRSTLLQFGRKELQDFCAVA